MREGEGERRNQRNFPFGRICLFCRSHFTLINILFNVLLLSLGNNLFDFIPRQWHIDKRTRTFDTRRTHPSVHGQMCTTVHQTLVLRCTFVLRVQLYVCTYTQRHTRSACALARKATIGRRKFDTFIFNVISWSLVICHPILFVYHSICRFVFPSFVHTISFWLTACSRVRFESAMISLVAC